MENQQENLRVWGTENPYEFREVSRAGEKVTVWCALSIDRVNGPYYLDDPIITGNSYLILLGNYFIPMLSNLSVNTTLQHDGALLHYSRAVHDLLV